MLSLLPQHRTPGRSRAGGRPVQFALTTRSPAHDSSTAATRLEDRIIWVPFGARRYLARPGAAYLAGHRLRVAGPIVGRPSRAQPQSIGRPDYVDILRRAPEARPSFERLPLPRRRSPTPIMRRRTRPCPRMPPWPLQGQPIHCDVWADVPWLAEDSRNEVAVSLSGAGEATFSVSATTASCRFHCRRCSHCHRHHYCCHRSPRQLRSRA
jgi:hypothetical protein